MDVVGNKDALAISGGREDHRVHGVSVDSLVPFLKRDDIDAFGSECPGDPGGEMRVKEQTHRTCISLFPE